MPLTPARVPARLGFRSRRAARGIGAFLLLASIGIIGIPGTASAGPAGAAGAPGRAGPPGAAAFPTAPPTAVAGPADNFDATREAFLAGVNAARAAQRLPPLRLLPLMSRLAQSRAEIVAKDGPSPEDSAPKDSAAASKLGYEAGFLSEVVVQADGDVEMVLAEAGGSAAYAEEVSREGVRDLGVGVARLDDIPLYVFLFARSWPEFFADKTAELSDLARVRAALLDRINRERETAGLRPVRENPLLDETALRHARDMLARSYYGHDSPEGTTALERSKAVGYRPRYVGENVARGQYSPEEVMDGWMASELHREHILGKLFSDVGCAVAIGKNANGYQVLWVQVFARSKDLLPSRAIRSQNPTRRDGVN